MPTVYRSISHAPPTPVRICKQVKLWTVLAVVLGLLQVGCSEDTAIRQYRVAKRDSARSTGAGTVPNQTSGSQTSGKEQLMLGAIVPNKDIAWFFKLTGDPKVVDEVNDDFRNIVKSVRFDGDGEPTWKLSTGWQQQITPQDITYGRLTQGKDGLTATVTRLLYEGEPTEGGWQDYTVQNINRWRRQLSLDDQRSWEQIAGDLEEFPELSQGPAKAYFVSLTGRGSGGMGMLPMGGMSGAGPAFGGPAAPGAAGTPQPPPPSSTPLSTTPLSTTPGPVDSDKTPADDGPASKLKYEVPEGWSELTATGMRLAAFNIEAEGAKAEVTVIAAGGDIDANIGIWLGQVGVEATAESKQTVLGQAEPIQVNSVTANLYTIEGKLDDAASAILIVDIPWQAGQSLFVKFKGAPELATSQREPFVAFVKSIQW